jgi:hypothetical protein
MILGKHGTALMILAWLGIAIFSIGAAVLVYWLSATVGH